MTVDQTANFVRGKVSSSVGSGDTSISVNDASIYPDPANGNYNLVLWDADEHRRPDLDPDVEIVRATSIDFTNNIISVSRSREGTDSVSHPSTSELQLAPTSKVFTDIDSKITSSISVTGNNGLSGGSAELGGSLSVGISGTLSLDSDLEATDGETIWDESQTYIPTARLENESMTIAGNAVSLGGSTSINHSNISNLFSDDHHSKTSSASELTDVSADSVSNAHHSKYTNTNAINAVESSNIDFGSNQIQFQPASSGGSVEGIRFDSNVNSGSDHASLIYHDSYFSDSESGVLQLKVENDGFGNAGPDAVVLSATGGTFVDQDNLYLDGADLTAVNSDSVTQTIWDDSAGYITQSSLENDTVTIEGNSVSLGGSTSVNHNDLSSISSNDHHSKTSSASELTDVSADSVSNAHHSKYTDENAQDAVGTIISGSTDISVTYDDGANSITVDHNDTSNQGNVSTGGATIIDDINLDGRGHVTNLNTQNRSLDDWQSSVDDNIVGFGSNEDFSIFYESSTDELVIRDETNSVDLIRQPKVGSTQFIQGADIGSIEAPEDSFTQTINAAATSAATSGDTVGYTFAVDNQSLLAIESTADGSGGISDKWVEIQDDLRASGGEVIWDEGNTYIPQGRLQNDSVTIEGNSVSLGGSTSVNHNDLSSISSDDHHSKYTDTNAVNAVGASTPFANSDLSNDTVTIEGNSVSLGGSTSVNHNDLSTISSNDHHSKTDSASELTDVSADSVSDAHHSKYTDSNAVSAVETNNLSSITFTDSSSDANNWQLTEDGSNGHLNFTSSGGGGTQMDLEHNGNLRLEGEITENSSL